ncbi:MAG: ATP-binding protein [Natrialbaceae archaeon]
MTEGVQRGRADEGERASNGREPAGASAYEALFDEAPDGIVVHDENGSILRVNDTLAEMLGYSRSELRSMRIPDIEIGIDDELLREKWASMEPGAMEKIEVEGTHRRKDGSTYPVESWVSKVDDFPGPIESTSEVVFIAHVRDISERRAREQRLEEQRDDLEILNQVVRHDIRNDLQLVGAYAELLEDHVDEAGREHLRTVRESAANAVDLTTTARELSEVMLRPGDETQRIPLARTLELQTEEVRSAHPEASVEVAEDFPDVEVVGDDMLDSVFRNLLKNAVQHNDAATPEIRVSAAERVGSIEIRIADNGPGVPDSQKEGIFGRGEKGLESGGTGLGLYLVRSLVDGYGGDVWVEDRTVADGGPGTDGTAPRSENGSGAVFVVELPVAN